MRHDKSLAAEGLGTQGFFCVLQATTTDTSFDPNVSNDDVTESKSSSNTDEQVSKTKLAFSWPTDLAMVMAGCHSIRAMALRRISRK
jgi:hypothetical protein